MEDKNTFSITNEEGQTLSFIRDNDDKTIIIKEKYERETTTELSRLCNTYITGRFDKYLYNALGYSKENKPKKLYLTRWYEKYHVRELQGYGNYYIKTIIECKGKDIIVKFDTVRKIYKMKIEHKYEFSGKKKVNKLMDIMKPFS